MASYNKNMDSGYTTRVQTVLQGLGADLGAGGIDGKWGAYTDAAYNQYKDQVDAALGGSGNMYVGNNPYGGNYYTAPNLSASYTQRTLDELLAEAQGLVGGAYDQQMLRQTQSFNAAQKQLAQTYDTARQTTQDSAVARGMGRSSYLTDAVANVGIREADAVDELTRNYNDTMAQLEAGKSDAVYSYAQSLQREQENRAYELALQQAQLQYQYDALNAEFALAEQAAQLARASASSGRSTSEKPLNEDDPRNEENAYDTDEAALGRLASMYELARRGGGQEYAQQLIAAGLWEDAAAAWEALYGKESTK